MKKLELIQRVVASDLSAENKSMLVELILKSDGKKVSVSIRDLAIARSMTYTNNFKGVAYYVPGLVDTEKEGNRNVYILNVPAIYRLSEEDYVETVVEW